MQHDCIRLLRTGGLGFILKTAGPLFFDCPHQNDLTERRAVTHNQQSHPSRECNAKRPGNGNLLAFQSVDLLQNCDFWIHSPRLLEFHSVFWNFRPLKSGLMLFFFDPGMPGSGEGQLLFPVGFSDKALHELCSHWPQTS